MTEITIHDAFAKCKILKKRIPQKIIGLNPVMYYKNSNKKINGKSIAEISAQIKSDYQSLQDDLKLLAVLNSKIAQSNATTKIMVGQDEYTITEALAIKNSLIDYKEDLLRQMTNKHKAVNAIINDKNEELENKADKYIADTFSSEDKKSDDALEERQEYINRGSYVLLDPINIEKEIKDISLEIDDFVANIDSALNVSNATTKISID